MSAKKNFFLRQMAESEMGERRGDRRGGGVRLRGPEDLTGAHPARGKKIYIKNIEVEEVLC